MSGEKIEKTELQLGQIKMADEVVAIIAGLAVTEVPGVAYMSGGIVDGIAERLGKKNLSRGVKVEVGEQEAAIDLNIIVEFGFNIADVAHNVQENVIKATEGMTGLKVVEVNINVQGINFKDDSIKDETKNSN